MLIIVDLADVIAVLAVCNAESAHVTTGYVTDGNPAIVLPVIELVMYEINVKTMSASVVVPAGLIIS